MQYRPVLVVFQYMEEFIIEIIVAAISGAVSALVTTKLYIKISNKKLGNNSSANDVHVSGSGNMTSGGDMNA